MSKTNKIEEFKWKYNHRHIRQKYHEDNENKFVFQAFKTQMHRLLFRKL